jgi:NADP-dependent 3-hydroxy acid dehydrogenase YdfG
MSNHSVLITGGTGGIGEATARRLLAAGCNVTITGRQESRLGLVRDRFVDLDVMDRLHLVAGDPAEYADVERFVAAAIERFGRLDTVIANAGFSTLDRLDTGEPDRWKEMVLINVLGPALLVKAALPGLRETKGRIVFVGSVAGFKNTPGNMYGVTKWAITGLAENARMLVTRDGVGVTLIAPGRVDTPFWGTDGPPDGAVLTPERIADVIAWTLDQPAGVDLNTVIVRPVGQHV